ncbi:ABC transporter transmembrane domain-containing protein [Cohnella rhizosphaerae]|uniref:ABC transporter transmembrane domain-containing protein n=1 Tax=Cohnella rhizosphaerae TaxID=1457232 RepID=A0A9X4QU73_9BACL|nr:ABC transporter transmembrane domain-containing protein [Cohnella rhizosphaerae]MDG0810177.1 ABC transporter transmembrane domain-containing protein [Cohnella rhizosphaerae]
MLKYFTVYRGLLALLLFCLLIEAAYAVAAPLSLKYLVDEAFVPKDGGAFALILGLLIGAGLLSIAASLSGDYALGRLVGQGIAKLRLDLFERLQRQSISFYRQYGTGDLVARFTTDTASVERTIGATVPMLFAQTLGACLGIGMLFALDWRLTLIMLAGGLAHDCGSQAAAAQGRGRSAADEVVAGALHERDRRDRKGTQDDPQPASAGARAPYSRRSYRRNAQKRLAPAPRHLLDGALAARVADDSERFDDRLRRLSDFPRRTFHRRFYGLFLRCS